LPGVAAYNELDKSYIRPARQVVAPYVHSAFPHLNRRAKHIDARTVCARAEIPVRAHTARQLNCGQG
jgi:hypothetical protein